MSGPESYLSVIRQASRVPTRQLIICSDLVANVSLRFLPLGLRCIMFYFTPFSIPLCSNLPSPVSIVTHHPLWSGRYSPEFQESLYAQDLLCSYSMLSSIAYLPFAPFSYTPAVNASYRAPLLHSAPYPNLPWLFPPIVTYALYSTMPSIIISYAGLLSPRLLCLLSTE